MSLFRRKPRSEARAALRVPEVACDAPGVRSVRIDYDPAVWLRLPWVGVDRTAWVEQALAAYADDLGWTPGTDAHGRLAAALGAIADGELPALAAFVSFEKDAQRHILATLKLLDDQLMDLEFGGPETFLTFSNDPSRPPATPKWFLDSFQWAGRGDVDDQGNYVDVTHAYRRVDTQPPLHLTGTSLGTRGKDIGPFMSLFHHVEIEPSDEGATSRPAGS